MASVWKRFLFSTDWRKVDGKNDGQKKNIKQDKNTTKNTVNFDSDSVYSGLSAGVTILLSLTVFLNLVAESMPTTSDAVPLIGIAFSLVPSSTFARYETQDWFL